MKKMKTHYYNAFYHKDVFFIQSEELSYEQALQDIADTKSPYAYTLEVGLKETKRIDLEWTALGVESSDECKKPEYEKLTGHEMGVASGRM